MRKYDMREGESEPIGLILCGSKDEQVIEEVQVTDLLADSSL